MLNKNKKTAVVIIIVGMLVVGAVFAMWKSQNGKTAAVISTVEDAELVNAKLFDVTDREAGKKKSDKEEAVLSENAMGGEEEKHKKQEAVAEEGRMENTELETEVETDTKKQGEGPGQQESKGEMNPSESELEAVSEYAAFPAMSIISETLSKEQLQSLFYAEPIKEELAARITGNTYVENENISLEDLRYVRILYRGFDEETHIGELIVNQMIADKIVSIFKELFEKDYQLEKVVLIDDYQADDDASVAANNTSAFNYRVVEGTKKLSKHSYGLAIDVNPLYNPYVTKKTGDWGTKLDGCKPYVDRSQEFPHKIDKNDICYQLFKKNGFTWGGDWNSVKDYQHFEYPLP